MMTVIETTFPGYDATEEGHQVAISQHVTGEPAASSEHTLNFPNYPTTHTHIHMLTH